MNKFNKELISKLDEILPKSRLGFTNVLVIDDKLKNLTAFKSQFRKDANIFTASNKEQALDVIKNNNIDIVFCDYRMPNVNGADILKEIVELYPNIKRSIITAYTDPDIVKEFKEKSNTEDIIYKPLKFEEILSRIFGLKQIAS